jgi:hypothetical protein
MRFSWPPTEDELAQYGAEGLRPDPEFEETRLEAGEPPALTASPAADTIGLFPSETRPARLAAFPLDASPSPSDSGLGPVGGPPAALFPLPETEPFPAASSSPGPWTPVDGAQTPSDAEDFEYSWSEATSISGIAVSPGATAVDLPGTGNFADEIVHLQALIEGLTRKIDWRISNAAGR